MSNKTVDQAEWESRWRERICHTPRCYNRTVTGYIYCVECLHGTAERAFDHDIMRKKEAERPKKPAGGRKVRK